MMKAADLIRVLVSLPDGQLLREREGDRFARWVSAPVRLGRRHTLDYLHFDAVIEPLVRLGYLAAREAEIERRVGPGVVSRQAVLSYELTAKGLRFVRARGNREPGPRERLYLLLHRGVGTVEPHLFLGRGRPDPRKIVGDAWRAGDTVDIRGPFDLDAVSANDLAGLAAEDAVDGHPDGRPS